MTARKWFKLKYPTDKNKVYSSKYYTPENSWPKTHVWWIQVPLKAIDTNNYNFVNFILETAPGANNYHYLKVPTKYLQEHLPKFHRLKEKLSLYLSANPSKLFIEERGKGKLDFSEFVVIVD